MKSGVVSTGNSLDHTEMDDTLMLANGTTFLLYCRFFGALLSDNFLMLMLILAFKVCN